MVSAKLHIICGNCGSAEHLKLRLMKHKEDETVAFICDNCGTIHFLHEYFKEELDD